MHGVGAGVGWLEGNWRHLSVFTWVLGTELRSSSFSGKFLYSLNCPDPLFILNLLCLTLVCANFLKCKLGSSKLVYLTMQSFYLSGLSCPGMWMTRFTLVKSDSQLGLIPVRITPSPYILFLMVQLLGISLGSSSF